MSLDQLSVAILAALAQQPTAISSLRLAKQLGVQQSSLLRALAVLGASPDAEPAGLGWVRVQEQGERKMLSLTTLGVKIWSEISETQ